jgi:hypothetical protein
MRLSPSPDLIRRATQKGASVTCRWHQDTPGKTAKPSRPLVSITADTEATLWNKSSGSWSSPRTPHHLYLFFKDVTMHPKCQAGVPPGSSCPLYTLHFIPWMFNNYFSSLLIIFTTQTLIGPPESQNSFLKPTTSDLRKVTVGSCDIQWIMKTG